MLEKIVNCVENIFVTFFGIILLPIAIFSALMFKDKKFIKEYFQLLIRIWKGDKV